MNSSTAEARAMQREEFGQFIHGAFASLKSTIDVIGGALETVGLIFSSDSAKRQEGISRVKEFGGNIWYAVNHPIKTMEALGSQIAYIAETEGISYLMGLGVGELSQVFSGKIVIKGAKTGKATKAADKAADAGKAVKITNKGNKIDITPENSHWTVVGNPGLHGKPNSSVDILDKNGNIKTRRWYDENGRAYRDVDMTNHGNSNKHPEWPHEHIWDWSSGSPDRT